MRKRKPKSECVPWYRARGYKGNLTETEKRKFDSMRMRPKHPAASWDDLPEEVQNYLSMTDLELYDMKQEKAVSKAMFLTAIGAVLTYLNYVGFFGVPVPWWRYAACALFLAVPWLIYRHEWNKNAEALHPGYNRIEEGIREQWELHYNFGDDDDYEEPLELGHQRRTHDLITFPYCGLARPRSFDRRPSSRCRMA